MTTLRATTRVRERACWVVIGAAGAGVFTQLLRTQLFGVSPLDPAVCAIVGLIFLRIALLAVHLPSQRASRTHPMEAFRTE